MDTDIGLYSIPRPDGTNLKQLKKHTKWRVSVNNANFDFLMGICFLLQPLAQTKSCHHISTVQHDGNGEKIKNKPYLRDVGTAREQACLSSLKRQAQILTWVAHEMNSGLSLDPRQ